MDFEKENRTEGSSTEQRNNSHEGYEQVGYNRNFNKGNAGERPQRPRIRMQRPYTAARSNVKDEGAFRPDGYSLLDRRENLFRMLGTVNLRKYSECLVVALFHYEVTRRFWHEAHQYGEERCGEGFRTKHVSPSRRYRPWVAVSRNGIEPSAYLFDNGLCMLTKNYEVHEINH